MSSFVIWANKGGIGKSTMTFQLACAAAVENPNRQIFVIDLSPQCDVSRMLLGGGHYDGEQIILNLMRQSQRMTVQAYLSSCANDVPTGHGWPNPFNYIIKPNQYRKTGAKPLPENLNLISGDFDLERTIQLIEQIPQPARRSGRAPTGPEYSVYLLTRSFIKHAVESIENQYDNAIIFIDTDPYFNVITTHMGLLAADNWITAYSPSSQASQFAVLRSIEFMYDSSSGLEKYVNDEKIRFPNPWYDSRGNNLSVPTLNVAKPFLLLANMTNPYKKTGTQSYSQPQRLHQQTIEKMTTDAETELQSYQTADFIHSENMWDLRRLGLICDYNGLNLDGLQISEKYPEPGSTRNYYLNATGGTPNQLAGYKRKLNDLAKLF